MTKASPKRAPTKRARREETNLSLFPYLPERIQIERSVSTMGFFSVKSGIPADGNLERTVKVSRNTPEGRIDGKSTIAAHKATGGFCGIEEQDVYYAILSAITEAVALGDEIPVPIAFSPGELLRRMGKSDSGSNYEALKLQLKRLTGTTVVSEKSIFRASTNTWEDSNEVFRVIDRVVIKGEKLPDGTVSSEHLIWLSSWQIENLQGNHRLIVDYQRYLQLSRPISRAIVPYLQLWLFASRKDGRKFCERLYDQLCELLGITRETMPSRIRSQFGPACEELKAAGYISRWELKELAGLVKKRYKLVFYHGSAFGADVEVLGPEPAPKKSEDALSADEIRAYVETLLAAGIWDREAHKLARGLTRKAMMRGLRIVDHVREREATGELENAAGFLANMLRADKVEPVEVEEQKGKRRPRREVGASLPEILDDEIQREAIAALEAHRAYENETDEIIRSLGPMQKAEIHAQAYERMYEEFPQSAQWAAKQREYQIELNFRRIVRETY
jgi:hypothetical protein